MSQEGQVRNPAAAIPAVARGAALVALTLAALAPALRGGFVFDDHALLGPDSVVRGPLWRIWLTADAWDYWPLTWTSLWLEWRLWGAWPPGFHAVNVALHAAAAVLLWRVLLRVGAPGAWLGAALFAVHPVAVESVAWISERKNVLSGALAFAAALAWVRTRDAPGRGRLLAPGLFALALLAKSSAVMLPVALAGAERVLPPRGERPRRLARLAPLFGLSLLAGLATLWFQHANAMSGATVVPRSAAARLADAAYALASYAQRAFFPLGVAVTYPEAPPRAALAFVGPAAAGVAIAAFVALARGGRVRPLRLALGWHATMVLPVLGLVDMAYRQIAPTANHLQYLALPGATALAGWAVAWLGRRVGRAAALAAGVLLVGGAGAWSFQRSTAYASDLALWERAAAEAPEALFAAWMYSDQLGEAGRVPEAFAVLERLAVEAREPATRLRARALWLAQRRRAAEAVAAHREAEALRPAPEFGSELGLMLLRGGEPARAAEVLAPIAREHPGVDGPALWLAVARLEAGDAAGAEGGLRAALALRPGSPQLAEGLALVLLRTGRDGEARALLEVAGGREPAEARLARIAEEGWARWLP